MEEKLNDYNIIFKDKFSILSKIGIIIIFSIFCFIFSDNVKALSNVTIDYDSFDFRNEFVESASDQMLSYLDSVCDVTESERFITFGFSKKFETKYVIGYCLNSSEGREFFLSPRTATSNGVTHFAGYRVVSTMNRENFYTIGGNNGEVFHAQIDKNGDVTEFINGELDFIFPLYYTSVSENLTGTINYYDYISSLPIESTQVYQVPYYTTIDIYRRPAVSLADYDPHLIVSDKVINSYDVVFSSESDLITKSYSIDSSIYKNIKISFFPKEGEKIYTSLFSEYEPLNERYLIEAWNTQTYCDNNLIHEAENVLFSGLTFANLSDLCSGEFKYVLTLKKDILNYNPAQTLNIDFISNFDSNLDIEYVLQDKDKTIVSDTIVNLDKRFMTVTRTFNTFDYSNFKLVFHLYPQQTSNELTFKTLFPNILPPLRLRLYCDSDTSIPYLDEKITTDYKHFYGGITSDEVFKNWTGSCANDSRYVEVTFVNNLLNYKNPIDITLIYERYDSDADFSDFYYLLDLLPQTNYNESLITDSNYSSDIYDFGHYLDQFLNDFDDTKNLINDIYNRFFDSLPPYIQFTIDFALILLLSIVIIKVGVIT